jgi:hypothetical protein
MNNTSPYNLYISNKNEFFHKLCAICLGAMFYPDTGDKMPQCSRLPCMHTFHTTCLNQLLETNHHKCPECRSGIENIINVSASLELAIRSDAFDHGDVDPELEESFKYTHLIVGNYPYHAKVFARWRAITKSLNLPVSNIQTDCSVADDV